MSEVVVIGVWNHSPKAFTPMNSAVCRFSCEDEAVPALNNPCKIPSTNFNYSFRMSLGAHITGDFTQIRDLSVYGDGNFATDWGLDHASGGRVEIGARDTGDNGCPLDSYAVATGSTTSGNSIGDPTNGHPYYKDTTAKVRDWDTCLANATHLIDSGPYDYASYPTGFYSKIWVMSVKIPPTATYGPKTPKNGTLIYNVF